MAQTITSVALTTADTAAAASIGTAAFPALAKPIAVFALASAAVVFLGMTLAQVHGEAEALRQSAASYEAQLADLRAKSIDTAASPSAVGPVNPSLPRKAPRARGMTDRDLLSDPLHSGVIVRRNRRYAMANHRQAIDALNLPAEKTAALKELIVNRWMAIEETAHLLDQMSEVSALTRNNAHEQAKAEFDREIQYLLGPEKYAAFLKEQAYHQERGMNWALFTDFWDSGLPLEPQQEAALARLFANRTAATWTAGRHTADVVSQKAADDTMIEAARAVLTPDQVALLKDRIAASRRLTRPARD